MAIDINQPVKQGHDMVLNYDGGEPKLGSASGYAREAQAGKLMSLPPNDNPGTPQVLVGKPDPEPVDEPIVVKPKNVRKVRITSK